MASTSAAAAVAPPQVVSLVDASFQEQLTEAAAFLSRSKPEAERDAFTASFQVSSSGSKKQKQAAETAEGEEAEQEEDVEVPVEERRSWVEKLVAETKDAGEGSDKDMEGGFNLLSFLVTDSFASEPKQQQALIEKLAKAAASTGNPDKNVVKYRILSNLFNSLPTDSPARCTLFLTLLRFAAANDELDLVAGSSAGARADGAGSLSGGSGSAGVGAGSSGAGASGSTGSGSVGSSGGASQSGALMQQLPHWLAQWAITPTQRAECLADVSALLTSAAEAAQEQSQQQQRAYDFQLLYLRFLSSAAGGPDAGALQAKAAEVAEKVIAQAIAFPAIFDFEEIGQIEAVRALKQSTSVGQLLQILTDGSGAECQAWVKANGAELQRLRIPQEQLDRKIRLLDLAELCASSVSKEISYATIAQTLGISEDDVEIWVIDVIRAGLVSGKLSQTTSTFRVYRSTHRTFGKEQWSLLENRLVEWQSSIARILDTITKSRPAVVAASQQQQQQQQAGQQRQQQANGDAQSVTVA